MLRRRGKLWERDGAKEVKALRICLINRDRKQPTGDTQAEDVKASRIAGAPRPGQVPRMMESRPSSAFTIYRARSLRPSKKKSQK